MKLLAFSVRDAKAEVWSRPMFMRSKGEAVRGFVDEVNSRSPDSAIAAHPEDYTLYFIGTFDESTGELVNGQAPESLGLGANFKRGDL